MKGRQRLINIIFHQRILKKQPNSHAHLQKTSIPLTMRKNWSKFRIRMSISLCDTAIAQSGLLSTKLSENIFPKEKSRRTLNRITVSVSHTRFSPPWLYTEKYACSSILQKKVNVCTRFLMIISVTNGFTMTAGMSLTRSQWSQLPSSKSARLVSQYCFQD